MDNNNNVVTMFNKTPTANAVQIFNHEMFGQIRVIVEDGKPLFCAKDVAKALDYNTPRDAVIRHCRGVVKHDSPTNSGVQSISYIPESDLYRLIMRSKLPSAEQFQDWVCEEVLPSICQTGSYGRPTFDLDDPAFMSNLAEQIKQWEIADMFF